MFEVIYYKVWKIMADAGLKQAILLVGDCHLEGCGVPRNWKDAVGWYRKVLSEKEIGCRIQKHYTKEWMKRHAEGMEIDWLSKDLKDYKQWKKI